MSAQAAAFAVLLATSVTAYGTDAVVDRSADAEKGKAVVEAHCGNCHSGEWQDETYESIVALLKGMYVGKVKHRFKIKKLNDQEIAQVAAYWTPRPKPSRAPAKREPQPPAGAP